MVTTTGSTSLPNIEVLKVNSQPSISVTEAPTTPPIAISTKLESLKSKLSDKASINFREDADFHSNAQRWSTHNAPSPAAVVNVASEEDIAATVKWAVNNDITFAAQSGAHGWTSTLAEVSGPNSIVLNLRGLNHITVDLSNHKAVLGGGVITQEVVEAAHAAKAHIMTGVCNTVGVVPALLGGGIGNLMALYGMGVDNIISARLVTATGDVATVSAEENEELFWGLRGAGHNFGIVSELTVIAHEQVNGGEHWAGTIAFPGTEENLVKIVEALIAVGFGDGKPIACTMIWARVPPTFKPTLLLNVWYGGATAKAEEAFSPLLSLSLPQIFNTCAITPYTLINAPSDFACVKNGHKRPGYGVALSSLSPPTLATLFTEWEAFTRENPDTGASVVLVECYDFKKARELGGEQGMAAAFPGRGREFQIMAAMEFSDGSLEEKVVAFGNAFRDKLVEYGEARSVYLNFATGDEELESIYGGKERLDRLRGLKAKWDPEGVFSTYNPIR